MSGHVTESIFNTDEFVIPMADVQHIEKDRREIYKGAVKIIMKSTRYNFEHDCWDNQIWLNANVGPKFLSAWCQYRHELEKETLSDL